MNIKEEGSVDIEPSKFAEVSFIPTENKDV